MKKGLFLIIMAATILAFSGCTIIRGLMDDGLNAASAQPDIDADAEGSVEPAATATETPTASQVTVAYETGLVTVAGVDGAGARLWSNDFPVAEETELTPYSEAVVQDGVAYLQANYKMVALDLATGGLIWTSTYRGGLCTPIIRDGVLYTCSYYGDPLVALSAADGSTKWTAAEVDETYYWAHSIEFDGDTIVVHFDAAGENQAKGTAVFDLNGTFISKAVE